MTAMRKNRWASLGILIAVAALSFGCATKSPQRTAKGDYALKKTEKMVNRYEGKIPQNREPASASHSTYEEQ